MPRSLSVEYPGAFYHVMARGNRREPIYLDDEDRKCFLATLEEACERCGWRVHAWVLMDNHYDLMLETPEANLVAGMSWVQNTYTRRFNVRHGEWGRLFGDRYKSIVVEAGQGDYYRTLMDYIHLNPARARLVKVRKGGSVREYLWSSVAAGYALPPSKRRKWLAGGDGLAAFGCADTAAGRRKFVERLDARAYEEGNAAGVEERAADADGRRSHLRHGWYWGTQAFAQHVGKLAEAMRGKKKYVSRAYAHTVQEDESKRIAAGELLKQGLAAAGLMVEELDEMKGSDVRKVVVAEVLWRRGGVSQGWICEKLRMKSAGNVSQCLRRWSRDGSEEGLPRALRAFRKEQLKEVLS